jgi:hypothetical protein
MRAGAIAGWMLVGGVVAVSVSGCAGSSPGDAAPASEATIAQSKSYAQLLRNEASSRLPPIVLQEVSESTDTSVACDDPSEDAAGLRRAWESSTRILVSNSTATRIQSVSDDLVASFVAQDWTATAAEGSTDTLDRVELSSTSSLAGIVIETAHKAEGQEPSIHIVSTGVCALTGGPDSDEVQELSEPQ